MSEVNEAPPAEKAGTPPPVCDIDGKPLSEERQLDWRYAESIGLRPSEIRFIAGEPMAVYKDGSGIYGPCPRRAEPQPEAEKLQKKLDAEFEWMVGLLDFVKGNGDRPPSLYMAEEYLSEHLRVGNSQPQPEATAGQTDEEKAIVENVIRQSNFKLTFGQWIAVEHLMYAVIQQSRAVRHEGKTKELGEKRSVRTNHNQ